ncbi:MAG TPA: HAMP domain-containing protein [Gammaproteobacteria bacterium]|nr:HAMP domain-containing protein [Gammaproteobacteria bacterium]
MNWFKSLSVNAKIMLIGAVAIFGFTLNLGFGYWVAVNNEARLGNIREISFPVLERTDANVARMTRIKDLLGIAVYTEDEEMVSETTDKLAEQIRQAFSEIMRIEAAQSSAVGELQALFDSYYDTARNVTLGIINGTIPEAERQAATLKMVYALKAFEGKMLDYRKREYDHFLATVDGTRQASRKGTRSSLIIGLVMALILSFAIITVGRLINNSIAEVADSLEEIATGGGDLTRRLSTSSTDAIGRLVNSFNTFMDKLQNIISDVANSTTQLATAAREMSSISQESKEGVNEQQAQTERVAAAMNEMSSSVTEVARNAEAAAEAAGKASEEARSGSRVVQSTVKAINALASEVEGAATVIKRLEADSENIGGVLEVIREISEQTNLLALNAAIEAARAGEQGRGFAVVADEVRTLASRTNESTQEIQTMIERLQSGTGHAVAVMSKGREQAEISVDQAAKAGQSLEVITDSITTINEMNNQISSSAGEQGGVAREINQNISVISEIGEQTSRGAQRIATASQEMAQLASQLQSLVGRFRV